MLAYLSRYTHRVAIANSRLVSLDQTAGSVTFSYKDYADKSRRKKMTLSYVEFLRRLSLHFLPERFVKIRHYGLLANRNRLERIAAARTQLGCSDADLGAGVPRAAVPPPAPLRCPRCGSSDLIFVERRGRLRTRRSVPSDTS